jgi:hypothetical protein
LNGFSPGSIQDYCAGRRQKLHGRSVGKTCHRSVFSWIRRIIRHIAIVILLEGDNKYKEGPYKKGDVLGETGEYCDIGEFEWEFLDSFPENE